MHQARDLVAFVLESEVAGVEEMQLGVGKILEIGEGAGRREDVVVLSPDDERGRTALAEELLEARVEVDVSAVVVEEVELELDVSGTVEPRLVVRPRRGIDARGIAHPAEILRARRDRPRRRSPNTP